jgi:hypothetical protein
LDIDPEYAVYVMIDAAKGLPEPAFQGFSLLPKP